LIVSKPQISTIISFSLFLLITVAVLVMNILSLVRDPSPAWYTYVIIGLLVPIGLLVLYRIFILYKVVTLGNNKIEIKLPVLKRTRIYPLNEIVSWKEEVVKTGKNSVFKELFIQFEDNRKLSIGEREHTEYKKVIQYLNQKAAKKKSG
jgi:hypothetical protein